MITARAVRVKEQPPRRRIAVNGRRTTIINGSLHGWSVNAHLICSHSATQRGFRSHVPCSDVISFCWTAVIFLGSAQIHIKTKDWVDAAAAALLTRLRESVSKIPRLDRENVVKYSLTGKRACCCRADKWPRRYSESPPVVVTVNCSTLRPVLGVINTL